MTIIRDAVYICVSTQPLDNHCIIRYNYSDDSFDKIAWDHTNLGFDIEHTLWRICIMIE
jgi:hypothetical protein